MLLEVKVFVHRGNRSYPFSTTFPFRRHHCRCHVDGLDQGPHAGQTTGWSASTCKSLDADSLEYAISQVSVKTDKILI